MNRIILVSGNWKLERSKWLFIVDNKGSRSIQANDRTSFANFQRMVIEDFDIDRQYFDLQLSYMFPKRILKKLPNDTPPVIVGNSRQFQGFLLALKEDSLRLCVEAKRIDDKVFGDDPVNAEGISRKRKFDDDYIRDTNDFNNKDYGVEKTVEEDFCDEGNEKEHDSGDESRFDYCDDTDGTTTDDEDFSLYGKSYFDEEQYPKMSPSKAVSTRECKVVQDCVKVEFKSFTLAVGQIYDSRRDLMRRLRILSVVDKFDFNVKKSTPLLLVVKCWVEGCKWKLRAAPMGDSLPFHVRVYVDKHTCSVTDRSSCHRQATPAILAYMYKNSLWGEGNIDKSVTPKHVAKMMNNLFGIKMEKWKAQRTLKIARESSMGTPENGYAMLPAYLYGIRKANPGTLTRLEIDAEDRFKCLFIAFGGSIMGFPYMRKVVVVDGTFLQGKYKGTLLVASAQDGNFQIFPIAFAVVETENDQSWQWFFKELNRVIPDDEGLSIISDRHRSIATSIAKVYPLAKRGICTYHLHKNIIGRFRGAEVFGLVKKAANAFKISEFQALFNEIETLNPELHTYLEKADVKLWSRAYFPGDRYNMTTSNIAESLTNVISDVRSLPLIHLLEEIREMMTRWFSQKRKDARETCTVMSRGLEKLLEVRVDFAKHLKVQQIDDYQFQVTGTTSLHVVNLDEKKCSCRRFDLEKFPCVHAIAVAEVMKKSRISLCHQYYSKNYLCNAYSNSVMPRDISLPVPEQVSMKKCLPPVVRQPPGRPKKTRMKSAVEVALEKKKPRKPHTCSKCHQPGHNRTTCLV